MKKINTALCSFGMSGWVFHAPFIVLNPAFNLYAVWERSTKKAADKYPSIKSFDSLEAMLADDQIDLVIVNTPNYTHFDFAKKALLAGKHVMVEKSFTVTAAEAEELVELATKQHKKLAVYQNRRYDSDFKTVKRIIDEGVLGDIVEAEFRYDRYNLVLSPKQHKETDNGGAGLLHDLGPHIIDQALYLFGKPDAVGGLLRKTRPNSVINDYIDILLYYPSKMVRLKASLIVKEPQPSYILHGTNGSFLKSRADVQEDELKAGKIPSENDWGTEPASATGLLNVLENGTTVKKTIISEQGNYMAIYDALAKAINNDARPAVSGEDGLNVMRVIDAVIKSDASGCSVNL